MKYKGAAMRNVMDHWIEAPDFSDIIEWKMEIIKSDIGGTDIDYDEILGALEISGKDASEDEIKSLWFDQCIARYRKLFSNGYGTVYRAIAVDDIELFLSQTMSGRPMGSCWTDNQDSASTQLHGGEWCRHDLLLTALVPRSSVEWSTTLQLNFAHPDESEIRVSDKVELLSIVKMETGEALPWRRLELAA